MALQDAAREVFPNVGALEDILLPQGLLATKQFSEVKSDVFLKKAQLLDVRSARESGFSPVLGSLNVAVASSADLVKTAAALQKNLPVYVFCRGAYCATAAATTGFLRERGFEAYCLRQTGLDWKFSEEEK